MQSAGSAGRSCSGRGGGPCVPWWTDAEDSWEAVGGDEAARADRGEDRRVYSQRVRVPGEGFGQREI